jgi:hypothetical protein
MKRKRYTPEEIIKKLREAEGLVATGKSTGCCLTSCHHGCKVAGHCLSVGDAARRH